MKYLCLAYEDERLFAEMPQDEWHALRQETLDYVELLRKNGTLIETQPLQSARKASTVRVRQNQPCVTDGPFAETKEQIGGFFMIEAASFDEAIAVAAKWPSARLGTIEVRPIEAGLAVNSRYR